MNKPQQKCWGFLFSTQNDNTPNYTPLYIYLCKNKKKYFFLNFGKNYRFEYYYHILQGFEPQRKIILKIFCVFYCIIK